MIYDNDCIFVTQLIKFQNLILNIKLTLCKTAFMSVFFIPYFLTLIKQFHVLIETVLTLIGIQEE